MMKQLSVACVTCRLPIQIDWTSVMFHEPVIASLHSSFT